MIFGHRRGGPGITYSSGLIGEKGDNVANNHLGMQFRVAMPRSAMAKFT